MPVASEMMSWLWAREYQGPTICSESVPSGPMRAIVFVSFDKGSRLLSFLSSTHDFAAASRARAMASG